jgi:hypothetical protein
MSSMPGDVTRPILASFPDLLAAQNAIQLLGKSLAVEGFAQEAIKSYTSHHVDLTDIHCISNDACLLKVRPDKILCLIAIQSGHFQIHKDDIHISQYGDVAWQSR